MIKNWIARYRVIIGEDRFELAASDNQDARYRAAELFKEKHQLESWVTDIAEHAKARLVSGPPSWETTASILELLRSKS